jgi:hypothetical protein
MPQEQTASERSKRSSSSEGRHHRRHRRSWWKRFMRRARERYPIRSLVFYCVALGASLVVAYGVTRCDVGSDSAPP